MKTAATSIKKSNSAAVGLIPNRKRRAAKVSRKTKEDREFYALVQRLRLKLLSLSPKGREKFLVFIDDTTEKINEPEIKDLFAEIGEYLKKEAVKNQQN